MKATTKATTKATMNATTNATTKTSLNFLGLSLATCIAIVGAMTIATPASFARQDSGNKTDESKPQNGDSKGGDSKIETKKDKEKAGTRAAKEERDAAKAQAKWFAKLDKDDRAAVDAAIGYAAPAIPASVEFLNANFKDMKDLRGKVVVIEAFTSKSVGGLVAVVKAQAAVTETKLGADDIIIIAVHTPEAADKAKAAIEKRKLELPILIDSDGAYSDALGAYRNSIAYIVDRQGNLRYGGLSEEGITSAAKELAAEKYDASIEPKKRDEKVIEATVVFPEFTAAVGSAADLRGKPGPEPAIQKWWNFEPKTQGKLMVFDFWATWCGPCRAAIPHMNEIAKAYPDDVACMGISDETNSNFEVGVLKHRISKSDFSYAVGIDPQSRMKNVFQIRGIPHVAIMSADKIVRWQGHPMSLTPDIMTQLVTANRALLAKNGGGGPANRWAKSKR